MIKSLQAVPALVEAYEKQADRLERALSESRENFETEEDLEGNSRQLLNEQIRSYETYISQDGERRGADLKSYRKKPGKYFLYGRSYKRS